MTEVKRDGEFRRNFMDQFEKEEAIRREVESETLRQEIRILLNFGHSEEEILPEILGTSAAKAACDKLM